MHVSTGVLSRVAVAKPHRLQPASSSVHAISWARTVEWVSISFSSGSSWPRDQTCISCTGSGFFTTTLPGKPERAQGSASEFTPGVQSTGFSMSLVDCFSALESFYSRLKSSEDLHVEFITKHQNGEKCSIFVFLLEGQLQCTSYPGKVKPSLEHQNWLGQSQRMWFWSINYSKILSFTINVEAALYSQSYEAHQVWGDIRGLLGTGPKNIVQTWVNKMGLRKEDRIHTEKIRALRESHGKIWIDETMF